MIDDWWDDKFVSFNKFSSNIVLSNTTSIIYNIYYELFNSRNKFYNQIIDNQILETLQVEINNIRRKKVHLTK